MILSDTEIEFFARRYEMIVPFQESLANKGVISHGPSSYGYDIRLGDTFVSYGRGDKLVDPLNVRPEDTVTTTASEYVIGPKEFVLAYGMEYIRLPRDVTGLVMDKSTYARCGITLQNTVLEAGWEGEITLEITNHLDRPVMLRAGQGVAQLLFFRGEPCAVSYADRHGKYQRQRGVTLPRVAGA